MSSNVGGFALLHIGYLISNGILDFAKVRDKTIEDFLVMHTRRLRIVGFIHGDQIYQKGFFEISIDDVIYIYYFRGNSRTYFLISMSNAT